MQTKTVEMNYGDTVGLVDDMSNDICALQSQLEHWKWVAEVRETQLEKMYQQYRWVPFSERLPPTDELVRFKGEFGEAIGFYYEDGKISFIHVLEGHEWGTSDGKPTCWANINPMP